MNKGGASVLLATGNRDGWSASVEPIIQEKLNRTAQRPAFPHKQTPLSAIDRRSERGTFRAGTDPMPSPEPTEWQGSANHVFPWSRVQW